MFIWSSWHEAYGPSSESNLRSSISHMPVRLQYWDTSNRGSRSATAVGFNSSDFIQCDSPAAAPTKIVRDVNRLSHENIKARLLDCARCQHYTVVCLLGTLQRYESAAREPRGSYAWSIHPASAMMSNSVPCRAKPTLNDGSIVSERLPCKIAIVAGSLLEGEEMSEYQTTDVREPHGSQSTILE